MKDRRSSKGLPCRRFRASAWHHPSRHQSPPISRIGCQRRPILTDDIADIKFTTRIPAPQGLGTPIFAPEQPEEEIRRRNARTSTAGGSAITALSGVLRGHEIGRTLRWRTRCLPRRSWRSFDGQRGTIRSASYPSVKRDMLYDLEAYRSRWAALQTRLNAESTLGSIVAAFLLTYRHHYLWNNGVPGIYNRAKSNYARNGIADISQRKQLTERTNQQTQRKH